MPHGMVVGSASADSPGAVRARRKRTLLEKLRRLRRGGPAYAARKALRKLWWLFRLAWDRTLGYLLYGLTIRWRRISWRYRLDWWNPWTFVRRTFSFWERLGLHVTPVHYYDPVPDLREFDDAFWGRETPMRGVELSVPAQLEFLDRVCARYKPEYDRFGLYEPEAGAPYFVYNGMFGEIDGDVLYCMIRHHKPRRIIEIGSGWSTLVAACAMAKNKEETGVLPRLVAIEPYPGKFLVDGFEGLSEVVRKRVQDVKLLRFESLEANDILFIDSTHVVKTGSDVCYEFLEILPLLKPGVIVHVHDIFLPREYPKKWLYVHKFFWNEAYLLQAFLMFNRAFEVLYAGNYLLVKHPQEMKQLFRSKHSQSLWMRRTA